MDMNEILDTVSSEHPYKVPGDRDSYSQYNEAWQDCIARIEQELDLMKQEHRFEFDFSGVESFECPCGRHYVNTARKGVVTMTENEAIELLRSMQNPKQDYADVVCAPAFCTGFRFVYPEPEDYAIEEAIKALKEVQQYRKIGTVEECRDAVEKQKSKSPTLEGDGYDEDGEMIYDTWICPSCGEDYKVDYDDYDFCLNCGQRILH